MSFLPLNQIFVEGKKYIATESFNGGWPTHDFLKGEIYLYSGCTYDRYDGAYLLGFEEITSKDKKILWWYDNVDFEFDLRLLKMIEISS